MPKIKNIQNDIMIDIKVPRYEILTDDNINLDIDSTTRILVLEHKSNNTNHDFIQKVLSSIEKSTQALPFQIYSQTIFPSFRSWQKNMPPLVLLLCFGLQPLHLGLQLKVPHSLILHHRAIPFIFAPAVDKLQQSTDDKRKLWHALQSIRYDQ